MPFWNWLPADLDLLALLRAISATADLAVGLTVWGLARRFWQDDKVGVFAVAVYPFIRIGTQTLGGANLTNLFAQGVFGLGLAWLILRSDGEKRTASVVVGALLLAAGFLSHFRTASVGGPLAVGVAVAMRAANKDRREERGNLDAARDRARSRNLVGDLLLAVCTGIPADADTGPFRRRRRPAAIDGSTRERQASASLRILRGNFGVPLLVLCGAGAVLVAARRRRDPLSLALAAWLVVTGGFAILGVVTPVDMRANLAAEPLVVILGATTLAAIDGRFGRAGSNRFHRTCRRRLSGWTRPLFDLPGSLAEGRTTGRHALLHLFHRIVTLGDCT